MENKVFIATSSFGKIDKNILKTLRKKFTVKLNPLGRKLNSSELIVNAQDCTHIIAGTEIYDKQVIEKLKNLKFIFRLGSGVDNIDIDFLKKKKIKILKSTVTLEKAVGELTLGLVLNLLRKILNQDKNIRKNIWKKEMGNLLFGKTLGIIGYGKIGKYVEKIFKPLGAKILINDIRKIDTKNKVSLVKIIKKSDILTIHSNYTKKNYKLINKKYLRLFKKDSLIINTSRPEILDYDYLFNLLKNKKIKGAALDVFEKEPYYGKFVKLDNVILTPHIGSYASEIRNEMEFEAVKKLIKR